MVKEIVSEPSESERFDINVVREEDEFNSYYIDITDLLDGGSVSLLLRPIKVHKTNETLYLAEDINIEKSGDSKWIDNALKTLNIEYDTAYTLDDIAKLIASATGKTDEEAKKLLLEKLKADSS